MESLACIRPEPSRSLRRYDRGRRVARSCSKRDAPGAKSRGRLRYSLINTRTSPITTGAMLPKPNRSDAKSIALTPAFQSG
jgi:hypothetical protein